MQQQDGRGNTSTQQNSLPDQPTIVDLGDIDLPELGSVRVERHIHTVQANRIADSANGSAKAAEIRRDNPDLVKRAQAL